MQLVRGYKQGRGVMFYDVAEIDGSCVKQMVPKSEVVELCNSGQITNAKIQMWEGKAIVRCSNKQLPLVKIDANKNIIGEASHSVRSTNSIVGNTRNEKIVSVSNKAEVVGKLYNSSRKPKRNTAFDGYCTKNKDIENTGAINVSFDNCDSVEDMFNMIASDFNVVNIEEYRKQFGKKVKLNRKLNTIRASDIRVLKEAIATYIMNMAYDEIQETYLKYK